MEKMIDIIIPAYNAHSTIDKALASIYIQGIVDKIKITIVDDCSPNGDYKEIISKYKNLLDINLIRLSENHGCGYARQVGIDATSAPFIIFMDADDSLLSAISISSLFNKIRTNASLSVVFGGILQTDKSYQKFLPINSNHCTWVLGAIYRRSLLETYNIKFPKSSNCEDVNFNHQIRLLAGVNSMDYIKESVYLWTDANSNRINTVAFALLYSKTGFIDSVIDSFKISENRRLINNTEDDYKTILASNIYAIYISINELKYFYNRLLQEKNLTRQEINSNILHFINQSFNFINLYCKDYVEKEELGLANIKCPVPVGLQLNEFLNIMFTNDKTKLIQFYEIEVE